MNENALTQLTFMDRTGIVAVPIIDCSIARILRHGHSEGFRQGFIDNPYLEQITLRQVLSSPLAMGDFMLRCRGLPHCGEKTLNRLLAVIESVAVCEASQNSGLGRVATR